MSPPPFCSSDVTAEILRGQSRDVSHDLPILRGQSRDVPHHLQTLDDSTPPRSSRYDCTCAPRDQQRRGGDEKCAHMYRLRRVCEKTRPVGDVCDDDNQKSTEEQSEQELTPTRTRALHTSAAVTRDGLHMACDGDRDRPDWQQTTSRARARTVAVNGSATTRARAGTVAINGSETVPSSVLVPECAQFTPRPPLSARPLVDHHSPHHHRLRVAFHESSPRVMGDLVSILPLSSSDHTGTISSSTNSSSNCQRESGTNQHNSFNRFDRSASNSGM